MNKKVVTILVSLLLGFSSWSVRADIEPIQKVMGKAETLQKKATAAQEKIMSYKKKMEDYAKKAKGYMNDAKKMADEAKGAINDAKGAINDAKSMAEAAKNGDFSSLNVMPSELKTAMADAKKLKKEATDKIDDAKSMANEAKAATEGATVLASQAVSDAKSKVGAVSSTVNTTAGQTTQSQPSTIINSASTEAIKSTPTTGVSTANRTAVNNTGVIIKQTQPTIIKEATDISVSADIIDDSQKAFVVEPAVSIDTKAISLSQDVTENHVISGEEKDITPTNLLKEGFKDRGGEADITGKTAIETPNVGRKAFSIPTNNQIQKPQILIEKEPTLQKDSWWQEEKGVITSKLLQKDTLKFASEASDAPDSEDMSDAINSNLIAKSGSGDSVAQIEEAKEKIQEYMRQGVTALYATGFTIRTNMMREPENRDVDKEAEDQIWKETILKAEECINRISNIRIMEAALSAYKYSESLQEVVDSETAFLDKEKNNE